MVFSCVVFSHGSYQRFHGKDHGSVGCSAAPRRYPLMHDLDSVFSIKHLFLMVGRPSCPSCSSGVLRFCFFSIWCVRKCQSFIFRCVYVLEHVPLSRFLFVLLFSTSYHSWPCYFSSTEPSLLESTNRCFHGWQYDLRFSTGDAPFSPAD